MRTCKTCGVAKPLEEFPPAKGYKDGRKPHCKPCKHAYNKRYYTPEVRQKYARQAAYGVTPEAFSAMLDAQGGCCAICTGAMPNPHIDHDHATGKVRGLLCKLCNAGLGQFKDDVARLSQAITYLNTKRV